MNTTKTLTIGACAVGIGLLAGCAATSPSKHNPLYGNPKSNEYHIHNSGNGMYYAFHRVGNTDYTTVSVSKDLNKARKYTKEDSEFLYNGLRFNTDHILSQIDVNEDTLINESELMMAIKSAYGDKAKGYRKVDGKYVILE